MDFESEINKRAKEADEIIKSFAPKEEGYQHTVIKAMNYSIFAGGKRLRPILMQEVYKMFKGSCRCCGDGEAAGVGDDALSYGKVIEHFMAAIEMIHTYSLVHDDLPAMDNDEYRRGVKTTHIVFGEAMGILAGDALLNYAYETAVSAFSYASDENETRNIIKALEVLAKNAGIYGMVGGQVKDVEATENGESPDKDTLKFIYDYKTGALLKASMCIGAILAGASSEAVEAVGEIASKIGTAFQIRDDILDVTGTTESLGKTAGSDAKNNKVTYVKLYGMENAKAEVERLTKEAVDLLYSFSEDAKFLKELLLWLVNREK